MWHINLFSWTKFKSFFFSLVTVTGSPHQVANVADITITEPPPVMLDQVGLLVKVTWSPHLVTNVANITITEPPPVMLSQVGRLDRN